MDVAVEQQADDLPLALISGLPELPPTMSLLVDRLNGVFMSSLSFDALPALRDAERIGAGGALEGARQPRERLDRLAVLGPALHRAVVQAQRERGVRIHAGAERGETRRARCRSVAERTGASTLSSYALRTARASGVDAARQHDHRIVRRGDGGRAAFPQFQAHGRIGELRLGHQALGERRRRFLRQQLAHHGVIRAQPLAHALEAVAEAQSLRARGRRAPRRRAAARCAAARRR